MDPVTGERSGSDRRGPEAIRAERTTDRRRRDERERSYRTAFRVGLAVSLVVHAVLVGLLSRGLHVPGPADDAFRTPQPRPPEGVRVVRVEPREEVAALPSPEAPVRPEPEEEPEEDIEEETEEAGGEPVAVDDAAEGEAEEAGETASNVERLTPRQGDARLWRDFWDEDLDERYLGNTRADSAIRAILGTYLDSLRITEEQLRRAREWTVGEGDEKWGISPEGIHLGDITIPLPVGELFAPTGPRRRELERELRELEEIQRQEALQQAEETRKERIEEMRERSREEAEPDSTEGDGG